MKKINSISYGGKIILTGAIFAFMIPFGIMIFPLKINVLTTISSIFFLGVTILMGFGIFLAIELHQDKKLNAYYKREQTQKVKISENKYECQVCGNREVNQNDTCCKICGTSFVK